MELISVGNEDTKYLINRFVLQELGIYLEVVWLWRISGGGQSNNWECDWPCKKY